MTVGIENLKPIKIKALDGFKHVLANGRFVAVSQGLNEQDEVVYALRAGIDEESYIGMALSTEAMQTIVAMYLVLNGELNEPKG